MEAVLRQSLLIIVAALVSTRAAAQQTTPRVDMPMTGADRIHWIVDGTIGPKSLGIGVIGSAGTLGILIPPSIMLVVMGEMLNTSVGALFAAAIAGGA